MLPYQSQQHKLHLVRLLMKQKRYVKQFLGLVPYYSNLDLELPQHYWVLQLWNDCVGFL